VTLLFRPEALAARQTQWLGSVRLTQPLGYSLTALVGLVVAAAIGTFGAFGTYTRKATVPGLLTPASGALRITNASGGTLVEVRAKEGAAVAAGDVLFVVSGERTSEMGDTQMLIGRELKRRAEIAERDVTFSKLRADERIRALVLRITAIDGEIASFTQDAVLFKARERIAREGLDRFERLSATGFMSSAQTDSKRRAARTASATTSAQSQQSRTRARMRHPQRANRRNTNASAK